MKTSMYRKVAAVLLAVVLGLGMQASSPVLAQDATFQAVLYFGPGGLLKSQGGGGVALDQRFRVTIANVNTGLTLLPALPGYKYRLIDLHMIAVGGAVATCTTVDILATQAAGSVKLVANAVAALTQSALLRAGATNSTILADGASFVQNDVATAITIGKTGASCATATNVDVNIIYAIE